MRGRLLAAVLGVACLMGASPALAHPALDRAQQLYEDAEFRGALAALAEAEAADDLSREDLFRLILLRAMAHLADGDRAAAERDAAILAAVDPERAMGREVPPQIRRAFDEARQSAPAPFTVRVEHEAVAGGVSLRAAARGGVPELVREVRVAGRAPGGAWTRGVDEVLVPLSGTGAFEHYAEVVGPGGALLASEGSEDAPLTGSVALAPVEEDHEGGSRVGLWLGVSGGVVAVAAVVITVVLVAGGGGGDRTQPSAPVFER